MKVLAAGCLAVAAGAYLVSFIGNWAGHDYIRAASEAAMVGGLADWFAITAVFRRPLNLPIPHTALIPKRKDALAQTLGAFMTETFLTRENVAQRLHEADVVTRVSGWLCDETNANRVSTELVALAVSAAKALDPALAADLVLATARTDLARRSYPPLLGRLLQTTVEDEGHQALTEIALASTHEWMHKHRGEVVPQLKGFIEGRGWMLWLFTTTRRVDRFFLDTAAAIGEAAKDPSHPMRHQIDRFLLTAARELQDNETVESRVNQETLRVLNDPDLRDWLIEVLTGLTHTLSTTLAEPGGIAVRRLAESVVTYSEQVRRDGRLRDRVERLMEAMAFHAIDHYADEFTKLVVTQVARWDGAETARRIELLAGRDLQFIRINGTVVGSLAGLAIYALSRLFS